MKYAALFALMAASGMAAAQTPPPTGQTDDMGQEMPDDAMPMDDDMQDRGMEDDGMMDDDATPPPPARQGTTAPPAQPRQGTTSPPSSGTLPSTPQTRTYDGPNSSTPGQPAPSGSEPVTRSQSVGTFRPTQRAEYPPCSRTVTDNCTQRRDPGN